MSEDFGRRLGALRRERHMSQEELADRLGLSRQAISSWERSQSAPDTANLVSLADLYGLSLDELLDRGAAVGPARTSPAPAPPSSRSIAIGVAATVLLSAFYYALLASPFMHSMVDDFTGMLGLNVSPVLAVTLFLSEAIAVGIPLVAVALFFRRTDRWMPYVWLAPIGVFTAFALAPSVESLAFGLPMREFTGIGGYLTSSVTIKADVLGLILGGLVVARVQQGMRPSNQRIQQVRQALD